MASLRTPTPVEGGQGVIQCFTLASVVTGDTVKIADATQAFAINQTTNDAISVQSFSAGVLTIAVANTPNVLIVAIK
jgi:hypothetical protein